MKTLGQRAAEKLASKGLVDRYGVQPNRDVAEIIDAENAAHMKAHRALIEALADAPSEPSGLEDWDEVADYCRSYRDWKCQVNAALKLAKEEA